MRTLVLGGTVFLGRHVIEACVAAGHDVTMLTRGLTQPHLFPDVDRVRADRDGGLGVIADRRWDAVIDTCGFVPRVVRQSLALRFDRYVFVSSVSAYADLSRPNDESSATLPDPDDEDVGAHYGELKAACERVVSSHLGGIVVRPGLIVGPHDPTGRFTYWPVRLAEGGDVLAPEPASAPMQVIDVRDLAAFALRCIEQRTLGIYNLVSPTHTFTMGGLLDSCVAAAKSDAAVTWVPAKFLAEQKVEGWSDMPVWVDAVGDEAGFALTSAERALAAGLNVRPLADTVRDTLAWHLSRPAEQQAKLKAGITPEREKEVLAAWHASQDKKEEKADTPADANRF